MGWAGFNCSLPHKVAVIEHLDGLGESAAIMGAVNCGCPAAKITSAKTPTAKALFIHSLSRRLIRPAKPWSCWVPGSSQGHRCRNGPGRRLCDHRIQPDRKPRPALADLNEQDACPGQFCSLGGRLPHPPGTDIVVKATSIGLSPDFDARVPLDLDSLTAEMVVA